MLETYLNSALIFEMNEKRVLDVRTDGVTGSLLELLSQLKIIKTIMSSKICIGVVDYIMIITATGIKLEKDSAFFNVLYL